MSSPRKCEQCAVACLMARSALGVFRFRCEQIFCLEFETFFLTGQTLIATTRASLGLGSDTEGGGTMSLWISIPAIGCPLIVSLLLRAQHTWTYAGAVGDATGPLGSQRAYRGGMAFAKVVLRGVAHNDATNTSWCSEPAPPGQHALRGRRDGPQGVSDFCCAPGAIKLALMKSP